MNPPTSLYHYRGPAIPATANFDLFHDNFVKDRDTLALDVSWAVAGGWYNLLSSKYGERLRWRCGDLLQIGRRGFEMGHNPYGVAEILE
jgi:hypothetical protein